MLLILIILILVGCQHKNQVDSNSPTQINIPATNNPTEILVKDDIKLCWDINYGGKCETFTTNNSDLRNNQRGDDWISSIIVPAGAVAALFEQINYQGACETFTANDSDLDDNVIDCVSSITVGLGCPAGTSSKSTGAGCAGGESRIMNTTFKNQCGEGNCVSNGVCCPANSKYFCEGNCYSSRDDATIASNGRCVDWKTIC